MATAYRSSYIVLGGLHCGNLAFDCYDWSTLLGSAPKRGENRVLPGLPGREVRPRVRDEMSAMLAFRLRGDVDDDNNTLVGGQEVWADNVYDRLSTLRAVCNDDGLKTITLRMPGGSTLTSTCTIEEMGPPRFDLPWLVNVVVDVTLHKGPIGTN